MLPSRSILTLLVATSGCATPYALHYQPESIRIVATPGERACVDRLLAQSRYTGYIEQTVDKQAGFFRVFTRNQKFRFPVDKKGKVTRRLPRDVQPAEVTFYNVQCLDEVVAMIVPMSAYGIVSPPAVLDPFQHQELSTYAASLGVPILPPQLQR